MINPQTSDEVRGVMDEYADRFETAAAADRGGLIVVEVGGRKELCSTKAHAEFVRMSWAATPEEARRIAEVFLKEQQCLNPI